MSVVKTENFASRCDDNTLMVLLLINQRKWIIL